MTSHSKTLFPMRPQLIPGISLSLCISLSWRLKSPEAAELAIAVFLEPSEWRRATPHCFGLMEHDAQGKPWTAVQPREFLGCAKSVRINALGTLVSNGLLFSTNRSKNTKSAAYYRRDVKLGALLIGGPSPNPDGAFSTDELVTVNLQGLILFCKITSRKCSSVARYQTTNRHVLKDPTESHCRVSST